MTEPELVRRCQKRDPKAQHALYDAFADRLYRIAYRYVKHQLETEDVVMRSLVKVFEHMVSFTYKGDGSLEAWMRKIVINEALMSLRRAHNFNLTESLEPESNFHDLDAFREIEAEYLYQLITELPDGYRTVFNLFVVEGFEHKEIAAMLGVSENTSRSQLFKAKELLKRKIKKEGLKYGT